MDDLRAKKEAGTLGTVTDAAIVATPATLTSAPLVHIADGVFAWPKELPKPKGPPGPPGSPASREKAAPAKKDAASTTVVVEGETAAAAPKDNSESDKPRIALSGINISVARGQLLMVVGQVGSGACHFSPLSFCLSFPVFVDYLSPFFCLPSVPFMFSCAAYLFCRQEHVCERRPWRATPDTGHSLGARQGRLCAAAGMDHQCDCAREHSVWRAVRRGQVQRDARRVRPPAWCVTCAGTYEILIGGPVVLFQCSFLGLSLSRVRRSVSVFLSPDCCLQILRSSALATRQRSVSAA